MSFKDTLNETRELLRKSNRQNLAHAYLKTEGHIAELEEQIAKRREILAQIEAAGDEAGWIDQESASKIQKIFNTAHRDWLD